MELSHLRERVASGAVTIEIVPHASIEARKDGLSEGDLTEAVRVGTLIEDYGDRVLLLHFLPDGRIPFHIVVEHFDLNSIAFVVTAYIPDSEHWQSDWKSRKPSRKGGKR